MISFSKNFTNVITCEINEERFKMLENNLNVFGIKNVQLIQGNCLNNIDKIANIFIWSKNEKSTFLNPANSTSGGSPTPAP